jgi:NAD(P)-dependent dehydrogenase (short-subunit alcohol dehydrogenase family)
VLRFDGKVVLVTGAAGTLGEAYARLFAERGATVVLNDLPGTHLAELADSIGGLAAPGSITTPEVGVALVEQAVAAYGRLDVVVNNAGIARPNYLEDLTWDDLQATLSVHLLGAFHVTKAAWAALGAHGAGCVVNTTSAVGLFGQQRSSGYGAAKMGIVGMTRVLAIEGAMRGIRVNAIAPVAVSGMSGDVYGPLTPKLDPALVASAVVALAHDSCSLNGEVISAGGGRIARIRVDTDAGVFAPGLDVESAAGYLATIGRPEPGSAMEEIDLIRVNFPELTEPMRYPGP